MNKTAIKNFAIWARNKLIADISYRAGLMGITADGIQNALPQSTGTTEFYDIGTSEPYAIVDDAVKQRRHLVELIRGKESETNYETAYKYVLEEVAYTWFNRLIAVRFMEVNDYLPSHIRVLSSDSGKMEPDLVTTPFDAELSFTRAEEQLVYQLKQENKIDELFRILFIKQCNALNEILPALFEKTSDYTELLLNLSVIDQDGVVYHLVHDIPEEDFDVERGGQVEIIGWLYQYYITEKHDKVVNISSKTPLSKDDVPAATQLFTTDWVVKYLVDNSLGRLWVENNQDSKLAETLDFYVPSSINMLRENKNDISLETLTVFDPCMGSGHFLIYAFEVLIEIYREKGYSDRDAAKNIVEKNLWGLDIDERAFQLAYFSILMKAKQYNRRILSSGIHPNVYPISESNGIDDFTIEYFADGNRELQIETRKLVLRMHDAKEYGSLLSIDNLDLELLRKRCVELEDDISLWSINVKERIIPLVETAWALSRKYSVVVTNPPYFNKYNDKLKQFMLENYRDYSGDLFSAFIFRNFGFCVEGGYSGFMSPFVWMFIKTYERLRKIIITSKSIVSLIQMEYSAYDEATVPICAFVLQNGKDHRIGSYFKLSDFVGGMNVQKVKVLEAIIDPKCGYYYETPIDNYLRIDGNPISFWASERMLKIFETAQPLKKIAEPKVGLQTGKNDDFLRLWPEVSNSKFYNHEHELTEIIQNVAWIPYNKGGAFRRWYGNRDYVINWGENGKEVKKNPGAVIRNPQYYLKPCITWSDITSASFSGRYCEGGFLFDVKGSSGFPEERNLLYVLGFLNSKISQACIKMLNPTISTQVGDMARIPVYFDKDKQPIIDELVKQCVEISKFDWDSRETSWDFKKHPLVCGTKVEDSFNAWEMESKERYYNLKNAEEELNRLFIEIYGLEGEQDPRIDERSITVSKADLQRDIKSLLSYIVGCIFGRYSIDQEGVVYAGGEWDNKEYSTFIPDVDNVIPITDEEYLEDDIVSRVCTFLKVTFGEGTLEENLDYIAGALGNKGESSREVIRNYFLNDFFKDHCQTYSVTGSGKRPIYWLFDSGKQNGFKALIYLHRYNADTIGNLRIDYLHRMQRIYESEISRMQDMIDHSTNAREVAQATKRREKLTKQLKECREYDEKLAHLALSRIELDLDDGVKKNYRKIQTANDGKFYEVLADSKNIMAKE